MNNIKTNRNRISASKLTTVSNAISQISNVKTSTNQKTSLVRSQSNASNVYRKKYQWQSKQQTSVKGNLMSTEFLNMRKQNYLNSCYNNRKNSLLQITKQNKKIYQRINSQKSNYSSRNLNKSYDSINSNSRVSQRSKCSKGGESSRYTSKTKISRKNDCTKKKNFESPIKIKAKNVNCIEKEQIKCFNRMFGHQQIVKTAKTLEIQKQNNQNEISEIKQYKNQPQNRHDFSRKLSLNRLPQNQANKFNQLSQKNHKIMVSLPSLKQKPLTQINKIQKILQSLNLRKKFDFL